MHNSNYYESVSVYWKRVNGHPSQIRAVISECHQEILGVVLKWNKKIFFSTSVDVATTADDNPCHRGQSESQKKY